MTTRRCPLRLLNIFSTPPDPNQTGPRGLLLTLWTSMVPLQNPNVPITPAYNLPPSRIFLHPTRLVHIYNDFTNSCSDTTYLVFAQTYTEITQRYPWELRYRDFRAGYAWFKALAIAALEIPGFLGEEEVEDLDERARKIKEIVKGVIKGQDGGLDRAFEYARRNANVVLRARMGYE